SHAGSDSALSKAATDDILSAGERLSVPLIARYLEAEGVPARATDATPLIRILADGSVDHATTEHLIRSWACTLGPGVVPVITGYVASKASGATATLGRGGSDYTAALFASALDAAWMERWTDVDGIYTADPRRHPDAERYERLTLAEAYRLNRTGGLGMHRDALGPLVRAGIPLRIRSTKEPEKAGTAIV
ncbi:MAG: aspartate kinase, partial [Bacteroidota bacterium]